MTYKECMIQTTREYAAGYNVRFLGYNIAKGSKFYGTLKGFEDKCVEMPICENLIAGMAIGLALEGYRPVVCIERHDFLPIALDAIVNHIDKMPYLSGYQFKLPILIRAIVGAKEPLEPGCQHTQDYKLALYHMLKHTHIREPKSEFDIKSAFWLVGNTPSGAVVLVEQRKYYDRELPIDAPCPEEPV